MINIHDAKIYIFSPPDAVSGGPEALHQLHYYMRECGIKSKIVYYFSRKTVCADRYQIYDPEIISFEDIEDSEKNIIIVPETATLYLRCFKKLQKCIWWLSVDNYFASKKESSIFKDAVKFFINIFRKKEKKYRYSSPIKLNKIKNHFCGSQYAYDFLLSLKKSIDPVMLVEPISKDFYMADKIRELRSTDRDDVILYNPAKPSEIMKKLLLRKDLKFKELRGFTPSELIDVYRHAKLYIDFGMFPGPERIPKESVYNGTCLLVGRKNASENDFDIPISDSYKIEEGKSEDFIAERIKHILHNYDECILDFDYFRRKIENLETTFVNDIKNIFIDSKE